jgi:hypothetical protein
VAFQPAPEGALDGIVEVRLRRPGRHGRKTFEVGTVSFTVEQA